MAEKVTAPEYFKQRFGVDNLSTLAVKVVTLLHNFTPLDSDKYNEALIRATDWTNESSITVDVKFSGVDIAFLHLIVLANDAGLSFTLEESAIRGYYSIEFFWTYKGRPPLEKRIYNTRVLAKSETDDITGTN